jgi:hypothetical protein
MLSWFPALRAAFPGSKALKRRKKLSRGINFFIFFSSFNTIFQPYFGIPIFYNQKWCRFLKAVDLLKTVNAKRTSKAKKLKFWTGKKHVTRVEKGFIIN